MKTKGFNLKRVLLLAGLLVLVVLAYFVFGNPGSEKAEFGKELLVNGGFEVLDSDAKPEGWYTEAYISYTDITLYRSEQGKDGLGAAIYNHSPNDARFAQTVRVAPDTTYRLSGYIKANAEGGRGANLSIADVYVFSEAVYTTQGDWKYVELYGITGSKQKEVTVYARLGGYSGESVGEASFDHLSLVAVDKVPVSQTVFSWEKQAARPQADEVTAGTAKSRAPWLLALALAFTFLLFKLAGHADYLENKNLNPVMQKVPAGVFLAFLLVFSLLTRLWLAVMADGFPVDINAFRVWADNIAEYGPGRFYLLEGHRDYPPGYMLVLWPLGLLGRLLGTGVTELMVKLPSILCDMLVISLLFLEARKHVNERSALVLAALYAFNPLTYLAGAAWGQVDSVPSLLLMVTVLLIMRNRWRYALPVYVLSVLMKPQSLMVGPLGLLAFVMQFVWAKDTAGRRRALADALWGIGGAVVVAAAVALPFFNEVNGIPWLLGLYGNTMGYYHYATVNATNLYFLFNLNWVDIAQSAPLLVRIAGSLVLMVPAALFSWRTYSQPKTEALEKGKHFPWFLPAIAALPALAALLPLSLSLAGSLLMVSVFLLVALMYVWGRSPSNLPLLAGILLLGFSVLGTMMHERYLFLSMAMLALAYIIRRDRRILFLLLAVSALCFINTGLALDRGVRIGGSAGNLHAPAAGLVSDSAWLEYLLSGFSLVLTAASIVLGFELMARPESVRKPVSTVVPGRMDAQYARLQTWLRPKEKVRFDMKDALLILIVTVLYSLLAFVNLGSPTSPQKPWVSTPENTQATLDLGRQHDFRLLFFGGIHWSDTDFQVGVSDDGVTFTEYPFNITQGGLFAWRYLSHPYTNADGKTEFDSNPRQLRGRYVRISGVTGKLTMMEVIAQDAQTGENLPFVSASPGGEPLMDEQGSLNGQPTWYNSMYFDEIYHARSAYEQRNGLLGLEPFQVYETSHPPLGKVLMTFSVMVFGMTPFGWRFAGALAGVLMLPGMYLLGKQFTRRRGLGLLAMLLMSFDFMHFAQTRIATIDSFVTLFIIYAYFFMFRYMMMDHLRDSFKIRMVQLALSGLMMGLAIASKWPGIYAGAGLAVLFFMVQAKNILTGVSMQKAIQEGHSFAGDHQAALDYSVRYIREFILTCLWCLLFFVAVPLVIYFVSYLPVYIATPGGLTMQKVIQNNLSMFEYHSVPGRGADHPYSSPWYSWPVSGKPIYFYSGGVRNGTSSVIWSFGNPLVWWGGLLALLLVVAWAIFQQVRKPETLGSRQEGLLSKLAVDRRPEMVIIAFLAQYLPWVLVPRGTYIYHYFPSVPFIILCVALVLDAVYLKFPKTARAIAVTAAVLAGLLFIAFFPYISGVRVSTAWLEAMRWFPGPLYY